MQHEINTWLGDINLAIDEIFSFLPDDFILEN
jgi:hypothetical protein